GLDYSKADLTFMRDAYELAMVLFSGRFQPSGKGFLAHAVGTASILASLRESPPVLAAGLLHNAYRAGDFGDGRFGPTAKRREQVRRILGSEVDEYLARFPALYWNPPRIESSRLDPYSLNAPDRNLLIVGIADLLEHLGDLDLLYYEDGIRRSFM